MKERVLGISTLIILAFCVKTHAGAKIPIGEEGQIDIGFRLQTLYLNTKSDAIAKRDQSDFMVRRARLRVRGDVNKWIGMFIQTEFSEEPPVFGGDARIIDAFIHVQPHPLAQVYIGENMSPALRQNLTSSGALMTMDRPGISYKALTWGTLATGRFATYVQSNTDSGLRGDVGVRDMGITLFGSSSLKDNVHYKYYLGTYNGSRSAASDRFTGRVQINCQFRWSKLALDLVAPIEPNRSCSGLQ